MAPVKPASKLSSKRDPLSIGENFFIISDVSASKSPFVVRSSPRLSTSSDAILAFEQVVSRDRLRSSTPISSGSPGPSGIGSPASVPTVVDCILKQSGLNVGDLFA